MAALPVNHPTGKERIVSVYSRSIGASPAVSYLRIPFTGAIRRFAAITQGTITTADCITTVARNGSTIGALTIPVASAAAGQIASGSPATFSLGGVAEDDVVSFTPSGASGANIACQFDLVIQGGA